MRFGICQSFRAVAALKDISFDYLEESVQRFLIPEQPEEEFGALWREARRLPVAIEAANSLLPANLPLVMTPAQQVDKVRLERYIKTALRRAEQVGISVLVFGSGKARACPEGHDQRDALRQIADHLAAWSVWARNYGVQIVLEPLQYAETNTLNTVAEGGEFVSHIAQSGARLLADTYHMASNHEDPETLVPWASLLTHVHVAELEGRTAPGYHGDDFRSYFAALRRSHYDQRISIECHWQNFERRVYSGACAFTHTMDREQAYNRTEAAKWIVEKRLARVYDFLPLIYVNVENVHNNA